MKIRVIYLCVLFILFGFSGVAGADEIHLKDGRIIKVQECWEEEEMIKYRKYGTVLGIAKDSVKEIVRLSNFERTLKDLENLNDEVRLKAVAELGEFQDERAVAPLVGLLSDSNTNIRAAAVESLKKIGEPATGALIKALDSPDTVVKTSASKLLLNLDEKKIAGPFVQHLKNGDLEIASVVYPFIIRKELAKGLEDTLLQTLKKYGTADMAREFVQSGNAKLAEAGLNWH